MKFEIGSKFWVVAVKNEENGVFPKNNTMVFLC